MKAYSNKPRNTAAPVFLATRRLFGRVPETYQESLVERTIAHIQRRLDSEEGEVRVSLFRGTAKDRQCNRFNAEVRSAFVNSYHADRLKFNVVDPKEWGFA